MDKQTLLKYLIIVLFLLIVYNNYENFGITKDPKLSVIVPFIMRDDKYLELYLDDVRKQTVKPYELIIVGELPSKERQDNLKNIYHDLPIIFNDVGEKLPPGINRNKGVEVATGDIYAFTDVDDEYHPKRNELLIYLFTTYDCYFIGHLYYWGYNKSFEEIDVEKVKVFKFSEIYKKTMEGGDAFIVPPTGDWMTQGHVTVHKNVFDKFNIKYDDSLRGEDCQFDYDIMIKLKDGEFDEYNFIIIDNYLSKYIPNSQQILE